MTEAIEKDVDVKEPVENDQEKPVVVKTKHDTDMEAIIARRRASERGEQPEPEPEPEPEVIEKEEAPTIELVDDAGNVIKVPATAKYKAKIDGSEVAVPIEKITRSYQKGAAGDKRLEQAARMQKDLEAKEQELTEKGQELTKREQSFLDKMKEVEKHEQEGVISEDSRKKLAEKLLSAFTESENPLDDLEQVLKELTLNPGQPNVDYDKIKEDARKEAREEIERQEKEREQKAILSRQEALEKARLDANAKFEKEYADIIEDEIAYAAAAKLANKKWAEKPDSNPWEIAQEVGNEIREWIKAKAPKAPKVTKPYPTPRSVSARAEIGRDVKPKTREDILAEMKKARGQPV